MLNLMFNLTEVKECPLITFLSDYLCVFLWLKSKECRPVYMARIVVIFFETLIIKGDNIWCSWS